MSEQIFFTSDLHFGHKNIMKYCDRPYPNVDEMNQDIIYNWNNVIGKKDKVYVLGDLSMNLRPEALVELLEQLNGKKFLIAGNHDEKVIKKTIVQEQFGWIKDMYDLKVFDEGTKQRIVLCHYPMSSWNRMGNGSWMLHGHCHGSHNNTMWARVDVGVDSWNYTPISYEEVKSVITGGYK